ncbi:MAG: hypothetical protein ACI4O4_10200, partial [Candidatus Ventricola sp.]
MACAPSARESQMRRPKPITRTTKCEALRNAVCLTSVRMFIQPPRQGYAERRTPMFDKWDHRFMEMARLVSGWASCRRRKVGAVIVKDKRVMTTGYNGAP